MQNKNPKWAQKSLLNKASIHIQSGQYENARQAIENHLKTSPYDVEAWTQRALLLILTGEDDLALDAANIALKIDINHPNAWSMQGSALMQLGRFSEALTSYEEALRLAPKSAIAHYNRGNALRKLGHIKDAITSVEASLAIEPRYTNALTAMGALQKENGNLKAALHFFNKALSVDINAADAHYNRALLYLASEQFMEGWQDYEWRLLWDMTIRQGQSKSVDRVAPDWQGQPTDQPILVIPEQGIGDQIFYAGMLSDLKRRAPGATVCLEPRLISLFSRSFPEFHFTTPGQLNTQRVEYEGKFSAQIHLGSLGKYFRNEHEKFQQVVQGYLKPDHTRTKQFRTALNLPGRLICGISWESKNHELGQAKSLTLETLAPLLKTRGVNFVDLQYGDTTTEIEKLHQQHGIPITQIPDVDKFQDIDALASLISACDIVVTVSNTTAHLAAALGKPVLVLLPNSPSLFWYWHLKRTDSPWYPSAVLVRQSVSGEWRDVVDTASSALNEFIKASMS